MAQIFVGPFKSRAFYRSRPVFRVSPQATHEKQEKRVFARTPRAPARGLLPLATPLSRLLNRPVCWTGLFGFPVLPVLPPTAAKWGERLRGHLALRQEG